MQSEIYPNVSTRESYSIYEFSSVGNRGIILKRVIFSPTEYTDVYGLILGNVNTYDEIDEYTVSNNGDRNKILATVVNIISIYLNKYSERSIYFTGSTAARIRLYRMAITLNLEELSKEWIIYAQTDNGFIPFTKNMFTKGFLIKRKS